MPVRPRPPAPKREPEERAPFFSFIWVEGFSGGCWQPRLWGVLHTRHNGRKRIERDFLWRSYRGKPLFLQGLEEWCAPDCKRDSAVFLFYFLISCSEYGRILSKRRVYIDFQEKIQYIKQMNIENCMHFSGKRVLSILERWQYKHRE